MVREDILIKRLNSFQNQIRKVVVHCIICLGSDNKFKSKPYITKTYIFNHKKTNSFLEA